MKLVLCYQNSEEGRNTALMFKYVMNNNNNPDIQLYMINDDSANLELLIEPAGRKITGSKEVTAYDNIRSALKSIFPNLIDPEPIRKKAIVDSLAQVKQDRGRGYNVGNNGSKSGKRGRHRRWVNYKQ
jgi:hypothetical protein